MFAPGVPALMREFGSASPELGSFCVSVYVLGFAAGPMVFAPLSELYGRPRVYNVANVGFIGECCQTTYTHRPPRLAQTPYAAP